MPPSQPKPKQNSPERKLVFALVHACLTRSKHDPRTVYSGPSSLPRPDRNKLEAIISNTLLDMLTLLGDNMGFYSIAQTMALNHNFFREDVIGTHSEALLEEVQTLRNVMQLKIPDLDASGNVIEEDPPFALAGDDGDDEPREAWQGSPPAVPAAQDNDEPLLEDDDRQDINDHVHINIPKKLNRPEAQKALDEATLMFSLLVKTEIAREGAAESWHEQYANVALTRWLSGVTAAVSEALDKPGYTFNPDMVPAAANLLLPPRLKTGPRPSP